MMNEDMMLAFRDELHKEAGYADMIAKAAPRLRSAGSLAGVGAMGGAALGAGVGSVRGYQQMRDQGAGVGQSIAGGAMGGLSGAGMGALGGAAVGAAGGALLNRGAGLASRTGTVGGAARFGQRQVHSLTGMLQPHELEAAGGGALDARKAMMAARANPNVGGKALAHAEKSFSLANEAQQKGLTSIPGYLGAMKRDGVGKTLGLALKEQWHNSPTMTAAGLTLPAAMAAPTLMQKQDPYGPGKGEVLGETLGMTAGSVIGGVPIVGNMLMGAAGQHIGRGIDRLRGYKPQAPAQEAM